MENFLNGFGGPVVTVSHDRYFLDKVANKILAFEEGGVREFFGKHRICQVVCVCLFFFLFFLNSSI